MKARSAKANGSRPRSRPTKTPKRSPPNGRTGAPASRTAPDARIRELESEIEDLRQELRRSESRVEAMKQIGRVLGSNLHLDPLLAEVVKRTTDLLEADRSTLFLVDRAKGELWSKVLEGDDLREIRLPIGVGVAGWVAKHKKSLHIEDAYEDDRFNPDVDRRSGYRTRGMLAWPVRAPMSNKLIGVIQVLNKRNGGFDRTDERMLEAIASEIGVALEVSRLYSEAVKQAEALEQARRELMFLFETERAISHASDLRQMASSILETALTAMNARAGAVHLVDERRVKLETIASRGAATRPLVPGDGMDREAAIWKVVESGAPAVVESAELVGTKDVVKSLLVVPIMDKGGETIGAFELCNKKGIDGFAPEDVKALTAVAAQAGRAIRAEQKRKDREQFERLSTIGRMLSGIMHDMRTPLTLISGYAQIMSLSSSEEERMDYAHRVHRQIDLLGSMTKELLAFARGERSLLVRKVHIVPFMDEMREQLEKELEGAGVALRLDIRHRGSARFDETKIRRVFHNIARNAREAMPGGGTFTIAVFAEGPELVMRFSDTGRGVPKEMADRLFEPFATSGKVGGTGLGLAMVKQIAEEHRGSISYVSAPRKGTSFVLKIPLDL